MYITGVTKLGTVRTDWEWTRVGEGVGGGGGVGRCCKTEVSGASHLDSMIRQ